MRAIFVSYRRDDSEGEAGRLFDDLVQEFGEKSVFMDVAAIEVGRDFRKVIDDSVATCGVLLAVIGGEWTDAKNEAGHRRLDDPADFVRLETASALRRDIPVVPVLVHGARMPRADQLPDDLKELAYRNGVELTHARWKSDVQLLIKALRPYVEDRKNVASSPSQPVGGGAAVKKATVPVVTTVPEVAAGSSSKPGKKPLAIILAVVAAVLVIGTVAGYLITTQKRAEEEEQRAAAQQKVFADRAAADRAAADRELAEQKALADKAAADRAAAQKEAADRAAEQKAIAQKAAADRAAAQKAAADKAAADRAAEQRAAADKAAADRAAAQQKALADKAAADRAAAQKAAADKAAADRAAAQQRGAQDRLAGDWEKVNVVLNGAAQDLGERRTAHSELDRNRGVLLFYDSQSNLTTFKITTAGLAAARYFFNNNGIVETEADADLISTRTLRLEGPILVYQVTTLYKPGYLGHPPGTEVRFERYKRLTP